MRGWHLERSESQRLLHVFAVAASVLSSICLAGGDASLKVDVPPSAAAAGATTHVQGARDPAAGRPLPHHAVFPHPARFLMSPDGIVCECLKNG